MQHEILRDDDMGRGSFFISTGWHVNFLNVTRGTLLFSQLYRSTYKDPPPATHTQGPKMKHRSRYGDIGRDQFIQQDTC